MAHMTRFAAIPMSKCMREMCKEEDYAFLNAKGDTTRTPETSVPEGDEGPERQDSRGERVWRRLEMERREQEKQREVEEQRRKKEELWKRHVAELASERESLRDRSHRLREFRNFQRKVLTQDLGLDPSSDNEKLSELLMKL
ncbi:uncharacterized protein LOC143513762 [Brachyhypopomus gauderio]|uniref:uncharacterized protein LOC143513762 n=1 Tax=Brachyhypopomus gauderio TaxID=698409 RepID=UPI00404351CA